MIRVRTAALAFGLASAAVALTMSPAQAAPGDTSTVCASTLTPPGFVDVSWGNTFSCGATFAPNQKVIKQVAGLPVGTVLNICSSTYPPAGWVPVSSFYTNGCQYSVNPSFGNNSYQIQRQW
jgi:predicted transglutaminase-like cysteine proteinase